MIEIAMVLEEEEANRALDEDFDRKQRPRSLEQRNNNPDQHWNEILPEVERVLQEVDLELEVRLKYPGL